MSSTHRDLLPRYKQLRQVAMHLNTRLVKTLGRDVLDEGGKKLGILQGKNTLVLDTEDVLSILMDFCIYDIRRIGLNAVERFLQKSPPPADSDEMVILQAMRQARYSLFLVEGREPGVGVHVRDLVRDEQLFLMDVNFSQSAPPGMLLAARIYAPEGMTQTTGAALPVGVVPEARRDTVVRTLLAGFQDTNFHNLSPEKASTLAQTFIRNCLKTGAAEHIHYEEPKRTGPPPRGLTAAPAAGHIGRNDPCPCGSGKKFKRCCGAPR